MKGGKTSDKEKKKKKTASLQPTCPGKEILHADKYTEKKKRINKYEKYCPFRTTK